MFRKKSRLTYPVHEPQVISPAKAIANFGERMKYGKTAGEWQRACAASLSASRRRRGLHG